MKLSLDWVRVCGSCLLVSGLALGGCAHSGHFPDVAPPASAPARGISVSGFGKANGQPDIARTTLGVEVRAGTAEQAIADVNSRMALVLAAIKASGVPEADIRTNTLSLNFERSYEPPPQPLPAPAAPPVPAGKPKPEAQPEVAPAPEPKLPQGFYTASNSVEVTLRNLDRAGLVVSAATRAGANQMFGIRFEIEDPSPLLAQARSKAVEDARRRAEQLAQLAGVKLGPAVSISEADGGGPGMVPAFVMMKAEAAAPIERGELTVTSSVTIVYALAE